MDTKDLRGLMEAYSSVYAPQEEISEGIKKIYHKIAAKHHERQADKAFGKGDSEGFQRHTGRSMVHRLDAGEKIAQVRNPEKFKEYEKKMRTKKEELDIFDVVLEFLQVEGYAETLEEAEWLMANVIDEEEIDIILGEAIYSEKGKAKAAEMIAKRSTPSGRAKPGKGANVAQIRQIRGSGRGRFDREGLGGTPMTPTMAKNPIKKQNYDGTGNKAARRAASLKKEDFEFWVNSLVEEGYDLSDYTWDEMRDIYEAEQLQELSNRKLRAYIKKSDKSHREINKKWDQGTATEKEKLKSIGHEIGQERAYKKLDNRSGR
jgi:hypothetical protein